MSRTTTETLNYEKSRALSKRAHELIPAGCHTYSKGDDQFPLNAPGFLVRGDGCHVWDADGNEFIDWGMGLRSVILGYRYPRVQEAVLAQLDRGPNFSRPAPIEVELAEELTRLVGGDVMVKFAKNGSDVTSGATRLARAFTGRKYIVMASDNPFYSFDDWFIGTTAPNAGIPDEVSALTLSFRFGDLAGLEALFAQYPDQIACVIIEPAATAPVPAQDGCHRCGSLRGLSGDAVPARDCANAAFLAKAKEVTNRNGALLIFDEMITGFRWALPGAQKLYGVTPDLTCFGKAMGNGFSVGAVVGRRDVMELGGIRQREKPKVFLLSATHGGETHALAAGLAVLREMQEKPVIDHIWRIGRLLQDGINEQARSLGIQDQVVCNAYPCSPFIVTRDRDGKPSWDLRTLYIQEMIAQGIIIHGVATSFSHSDADLQRTLDASAVTLETYRRALESGVEKFLVGPAVKPVFRKFN